ncbi:odorant receptor Or2-like [Anastrepha obliqua]|uniref:odorant receptor Or2-like n=1 Tax=Anastrepha obliqua TaxID=95512 RepID=UPI00240A3F36|nr:odorant receptor Or2-like [Anastrepha obliqua]
MPTVVCVLVGFAFFMSKNDLEEDIYNFFIIMVCFTAILRVLVVLTRQRKFLDLFKVIEYWYIELQLQKSENALEKLNELTKRARFCTKYGLRCALFVDVFIALQPMITGYGKLVADVKLPGIDFHKSPIYEIMYLLQTCWVLPITTCSYVPYVNFLLIFISFGIFAIRDLQRRLEDLCLMDDKDALDNVKRCVAYHVRIIKFREDLEQFFSLMSLLDASLYCVTLCMMLVYTTMEFTMPLLIKGIGILLVLTTLIFLTYWLADTFTHESLNIAEVAYNTNWMDRDKEFRRCILLIIARSQRPLTLTAGGFKPMNMNTFMVIMRSSYSFFSLLQSTM